MRTFEILGHDNVALSIALDTLFQLYGEGLRIRLVNNINEDENAYRETKFAIDGFEIEEVQQKNWQPCPNALLLLVAMAPRTRKAIFDSFVESHAIEFEQISSVVHPDTTIARQVDIGSGFNMGPQSVVAPYATVGKLVMISRCVSVGHHSVIEDFVTINPGATITGSCHLEQGVTIGAGATIYDSVRVGAGSFIGAGSLVNKDVPAGVIAYGSPATVVRSI